MPKFVVHGRFSYRADAEIEAMTYEEAQMAFDNGNFEVDEKSKELIHWSNYGVPEEVEEDD